MYDEYVNMNIIDKLKSMGMRPLTLEMMPSSCFVPKQQSNAEGNILGLWETDSWSC